MACPALHLGTDGFSLKDQGVESAEVLERHVQTVTRYVTS